MSSTSTPGRSIGGAMGGMTSPSLPNLSRKFSTTSTTSSGLGSPNMSGSVSGSGAASERKRRAKNLLRDYYGLAGASGSGASSGSNSPIPGTGRQVRNELDIDSPASFNPDAYFSSLTNEASLLDLLRKENQLLTEIRELDGERQSLVYNHHHELIEASDTIRKMKSRALALDASLDSLKTSFESISQVSAFLSGQYSSSSSKTPTLNSKRRFGAAAAAASPPPTPPTTSRYGVEDLDETPTKMTSNHDRPMSSTPPPVLPPPPPAPSEPVFDPLLHLPALLSLPLLLRSLLGSGERAKADSLWGLWEPALRSWEDEGVEGVKEVGMECREVLRGARKGSVGAKDAHAVTLNLKAS